jgi:5-methylcytosine-specific restriction endonuclease McrA
MINPDGTKTCPRCGLSKLPGGNFYKSGRSADGFAGYCISCAKEAATGWQKALPKDRRRSRDQKAWEAFKELPEEERRRRNAKRAEAVTRWINKSPENKVKQRAWQQAYKERDPERRRMMNQISNNRARAKRGGLPNNFHLADWREVLGLFQHCCAFCGAKDVLLDLEHVVPMNFGGPNTPGNVVPACRPCNAQKSGRSLEAFLKVRPDVDIEALRGKVAGLVKNQ